MTLAPKMTDLAAPAVSPRPAAGQGLALTSDIWVPAEAKHPGQELAYKQFESNVSVTATTEGTANTVVQLDSVEFDGKPILIEFYCIAIGKGTNTTNIYLYEETTGTHGSIGRVALSQTAFHSPGVIARRLSPVKGPHIYSIRAAVDAGTGTVYAAEGGSGKDMPGYIRITRAAGGTS